MNFDIKKHFPNACQPGIDWYSTQPDFETAWNTCQCGEWLAWLAEQLGVEERLLVLTGGRCAETVIHLMTDGRSKVAVKAAIAFGNGKIGEAELKTARKAAAAARETASEWALEWAAARGASAWAASAWAAVAAARAASAWASARGASAWAARAAARAASAWAALAAARAAAGGVAHSENQLQTANICREILTKAVFQKVRELQ